MVFGCRVRNLYLALLKPVEMRVGANRVQSDSHGMGIGISILNFVYTKFIPVGDIDFIKL